MRLRRDLMRLAGLACLAGAGALEGLLLAKGPVLQDYSAVRLGPHGIFVDLTWLCVLALGALGAIAGLARWLRTLFLTLLPVAISWSLAHASQHPWWLLHANSAWRVTPISAAVLAGHALALTLVVGCVLIEALRTYRDAATAQGMPPGHVDGDTLRLVARATAVLGACFVAAFMIPAFLGPLASGLRGAVQGPAAFVALLASTAALLVGLALLAAPARPRRKRRVAE